MSIIAEIRTEEGEIITKTILPPKDFKTGSKGFFSSCKAEIEGKRYQVQIQLVEIGSKPKTEENAG